MINSSIFKSIVLCFSVIFFVACDSDFNELGSNIIEDDIHHNNLTRTEVGVTAYDRSTGAVQTNNLTLNSIGFYNNPAFGKTTAHFVSQLRLGALNPAFTSNVVIDTVYFYAPYFTKSATGNGDGTTSYVLDSIYGNMSAPMRLNLYENRYFLRDADPTQGTTVAQKYYSDQLPLIHNERNPARLNDSDVLAENEEFKISAAQIERKNSAGTVLERLAPGIFLHLNKDFFREKIVNSPSKLVNQTVFKEWFRGLYLNIEPTGTEGAMATMNFSNAKVVIIYRQDAVAGTEGSPSPNRERKTLELNLGGTSAVNVNTANFFVNDYNPSFTSGIASFDESFGDERLYLKGGEGSVAFINLNQQDLLNLTEDETGQKILINDAQLSFYVDQSAMGGVAKEDEPFRIYLYDLKNKRPVYDYYTDASSSSLYPKYNKAVHGGIIERSADGKGFRYRIRITNHINNIINKDSTNVRLALAVTETINTIANVSLRTPINNTTGDVLTNFIPVTSVMSSTGTIIYGSHPSVPDDKRLKLEIFYTKPN